MFDKEAIIKTIENYDVGYKEITQLDCFHRIISDNENFEIRYAGCNYIVVTKDTVKLYFGLHYKTFEKSEADEKSFYEDLNQSLKLIAEGCEVSWA